LGSRSPCSNGFRTRVTDSTPFGTTSSELPSSAPRSVAPPGWRRYRKRKQFDELTDQTVERMEAAIQAILRASGAQAAEMEGG